MANPAQDYSIWVKNSANVTMTNALNMLFRIGFCVPHSTHEYRFLIRLFCNWVQAAAMPIPEKKKCFVDLYSIRTADELDITLQFFSPLFFLEHRTRWAYSWICIILLKICTSLWSSFTELHSHTNKNTHRAPPRHMQTQSTWQDCWCLSCLEGEMSRDKELWSSCLFTSLSQQPDSSPTL